MHITLKTKISAAVFGVVGLALLTSGIVFFSSPRLAGVLHRTVNDNLPSIRAAEELEIAVLEQRGLASAYMLEDGNARWLVQLPAKRQAFAKGLEEARALAHTEREQQILSDLERVYKKYDSAREKAVELFGQGRKAEAKRLLLGDVQRHYDEAYRLCEEFIDANINYVASSTTAAATQVAQTTRLVMLTAMLTVGLGVGLLWLFYAGVLRPLRRMAAAAGRFTGQHASAGDGDELGAVGESLRRLMSDVTEARSSLEENRAKLSSAEKLAAVGRLAASVAHEIRNPLTAVKMWLFSIRKAVADDEDLSHKVQIVSDEVGRLESIVRNFLEFSRPPALKLQRHDVRVVVQKTLELCSCRFEESELDLEADIDGTPLWIVADSEQLRQVLINLLNNAADATEEEGTIRVTVLEEREADGRRAAVIRIADSGCGMPADVQERIFEPFFSTKQQGTGLGLSIAAQIMARHEGRLVLESSTPNGTTFAMRIPMAEE